MLPSAPRAGDWCEPGVFTQPRQFGAPQLQRSFSSPAKR
jgi:hypothetical protein